MWMNMKYEGYINILISVTLGAQTCLLWFVSEILFHFFTERITQEKVFVASTLSKIIKSTVTKNPYICYVDQYFLNKYN